MKKNDLLFIILALAILFPFIPFPFLSSIQKGFIYNPQYWVFTSFLKFALLATMGEVIGLRIKTGVFNTTGFGILPRAIVWGFLGITIKLAFDIFAIGIPGFLEKSCSITGVADAMKTKDISDAIANGMGGTRLLAAFCISTAMNLIYAPIMMTFHKITDTHIVDNGGTINGLFKKIHFGDILSRINWNVQWNFVFKKTIPFFWIPAHTITFLLPSEYRVAFAALLGIALGIILSLAAIKGKTK
ncbi:MAG: Mpv17/PMP22 family protein [Bacteroidetes bacterium]|nr:Mpv17/PMP22 family protein [Bacteroidota bacterium]